MGIFLYNLGWMSFNSFLAIIPVVFGYLILKSKINALRIISFLIWLVFVPNTIYIVTDLIDLPEQWIMSQLTVKVLLLFQYFILEIIGIITFVISIYFFEKFLLGIIKKTNSARIIIFLMNILIAFGVILGRIHRVNSWEVLTNPMHVVNSSLFILSSIEQITMVLIFGLFGYLLYEALKEKVSFYLNKRTAETSPQYPKTKSAGTKIF